MSLSKYWKAMQPKTKQTLPQETPISRYAGFQKAIEKVHPHLRDAPVVDCVRCLLLGHRDKFNEPTSW
jgi:hypothetical protein